MPQNHWQLDKHFNRDRLRHIFENAVWCDCTFIVGEKAVETTFHSHKMVLSMASPVFKDLLHKETYEISMPDVTPDAFKAILRYIYLDDTDFPNSETAMATYSAAKKLKLLYLLDHAKLYLLKNNNYLNTCKIYELGKLHNDDELMNRSLEVIRHKTLAVVTAEPFVDITRETLLDILDQDSLAADEVHICTAVYNWAVSFCENKEAHGELVSLRAVVDPALKKIRFLTLSPLQFVKGPAQWVFLQDAEKLNVLMNLVDTNGKFVLPIGWSSSRVSRNMKR